MKLPYRNEVPVELTWDLSLIYATEEEFEKDVEKLKTLSCQMVEDYKGKMETSAAVNACLDDYQEIKRLISLTRAYRDLAASVNFLDGDIQQKNDVMQMLIAEVESRLSFIDTDISALSEEVLAQAAKESDTNRGYIERIIRNKAHQLSPETEKVLAALSRNMDAPYQIYNMAKLADMKFDSFVVDGEEFPLGYSLFEDAYEYDPRTEVRRKAFETFSKKIREYENVTAAAYNTQVQKEKIMATLRGFDSVFDALLFPQNVTREMYDRQIDLITKELAPHMRKYAKLVQKAHNLDKMTFADLKLPLDPGYSPSVTIEESRQLVHEGLSVLGEDYQNMVNEAYRDRWFDFAKNHGKSTGGFCETPYGKGSFILLSWNGNMSDVFTIAHELGHAGHFDACNKAQSFLDTDVSSYFVEAPSTMNEIIMTHYMLKKNTDTRFRRWVLSNMINNTYYHNFVTHLLEAAYQREVYKIIDAGGSVKADTLSGIYRKVLTDFWGDAVEITEGAELTWMRQPHYYMGLYSYTYSAGLTVATQACLRIEREGKTAVEDWKKVLDAGSTKDAVGLAAMAGVDITTDKPLRDTIAYVGSIIDEIAKLTEEMETN